MNISTLLFTSIAIAFFFMLTCIIWLPIGASSINKKYREYLKSKKSIFFCTGRLLISLGIVGVILVGFGARQVINDRRVEFRSAVELTQGDWLKIEQIKFLHFFKLASNSNYVQTNSYKNTEKTIYDYEELKRKDSIEINKLTRENEAQTDRQMYLAYVLGLLMATITFSLGGSFIARGLFCSIDEAMDGNENKKE